MKITKLLILTFAISLSTVFAQENIESDPDFSRVDRPYLGQNPPGLIPELFAPDIIKTKHREAEAAFTPDLKEFYFRRRGGEYKNNTLVVIQYKDNRWTESVVPPRAGEPFISPDGKMLYLGNKYRERINSGWSEVKSLGAPFKDIPIMRLTVSSKGTYYFDIAAADGTIWYSRLIDGKYEKPIELGKEINSGIYSSHPFIAPDESYLIWDSKERKGGYGDADLYISFRQKDGSWGTAINLGDKINTEFAEAFGSVSPDGKYFFFHRGYGNDKADIFWVDAQIIETLRPKQYFGQKTPGLIPKVFAPGKVSINGRFESTISFSPDLKELYFDAKYEDKASQIYFSKLVNGAWTPIKKANFTKGNKKEEMHPFVSPDGKRIFFTAFDTIFSDERIWYVKRLKNSWSDAIKLDSPVNNDKIFFPNHAKNGGLYYLNLSKFKTYYAPNKKGKFIEPQAVNIDMGHHAFISPNDDYLLVTARNKEEKNRKDNDIYVYFKNQDGTWSKPINLGNTVNTNFSEKTPSISPDGKYLFFGRDERDIEPGLANIYWVSTEIIEKLRQKQ